MLKINISLNFLFFKFYAIKFTEQIVEQAFDQLCDRRNISARRSLCKKKSLWSATLWTLFWQHASSRNGQPKKQRTAGLSKNSGKIINTRSGENYGESWLLFWKLSLTLENIMYQRVLTFRIFSNSVGVFPGILPGHITVL